MSVRVIIIAGERVDVVTSHARVVARPHQLTDAF